MSSNQSGADPNNPYNIDFARERRLKRMFQLLIGGGVAVAALLLILAFTMDALLRKKLGDPVPVTPYSTPARAADQPVTPR